MASYRDFLPVVSDGEWVRPSDWLALPTVTEAEEKFVGLHAVFPEGNNFCALLFRGAYTVDWGDGVVENVADNVKAEHVYDYASISNATLTSRGYKQVIVTVTPQVGQNLTTINFQQIYTGQNQAYATGWLDVTGSFPNAGAGATITFGGTTVRHGFAEQVTWLTIGSCTSMASMFRTCNALQSVPLYDTSLVTSMLAMFLGASSIRNIPLFNTSIVSDMSSMFDQCSSLIEIPLFDTQSVTNMGSFAGACVNLRTIPSFNTPLLNNLLNAFFSCTSFKSLPLINTALVTNMNSMFANCRSLQALPALSTASITTGAGTDFGVNFAINNNSLDRCEMIFARTVGFSSCQLGVDALVEIFTNLVDRTATTSATITITSNWGAALLTAGQRAIATDKNWLITG